MNLSEWTKGRIREELKLVGIKPVGVVDYPPAKETGYFLSGTQIQQLPVEQRNAIKERRRLERSGTQEFKRFCKAMYEWVEEENERRYQQGLKKGTVLSPEQIEEYMSIIVSRLGNLEIAGYEEEDIEGYLNITVYKNPVAFDKAIREGTCGYESNNSLTDGTETKVHILSGDVQPGYEHEILYNIANEEQTGLKDDMCSDFDLSTSQIVAIQKENMYEGSIYEAELNIALYVPDLELAKVYDRYEAYYVKLKQKKFENKIIKALGGKSISREQMESILAGYDFRSEFEFPKIISTSEPSQFADLTYSGVKEDGDYKTVRRADVISGDVEVASVMQSTQYYTYDSEPHIESSTEEADFSLKTVQIVGIGESVEDVSSPYDPYKYSIVIYVPDKREYSVDTYKEFVEMQGKMTELEQLKSEHLLLKQEQQTIREAEKLIEKANEREEN